MSIFLERIREFSKANNISLRHMSIGIGLSEAYLSNSIKQGSVPSVDVISKIIDKYPELNPSWLLTGKGEMLKNLDMVEEEGLKYQRKQSIDEIIDEKIEEKLSAFNMTIREIIINEIEDEIRSVNKKQDVK